MRPAQRLPDGVVVDVVDADVEALQGERDGERQADVAASTNNTYIIFIFMIHNEIIQIIVR